MKNGRPDLAPAIQQDYDDRVDKKQQQRGRQIVWILKNKHTVSEGTGKFYDIRDLFGGDMGPRGVTVRTWCLDTGREFSAFKEPLQELVDLAVQ